MALGVLRLLDRPDQVDALRAEPALVVTAVDEVLRLDHGSTTDQLRVATGEVEFAGVVIHPGEIVVAPLRCANRDPKVFADPDRLDITRAVNPHLAFAHGPHHCLGPALARMLLQVGLGTLIGSLPQLHLAVPVDELSWHTFFFTLNGPEAVPLAW